MTNEKQEIASKIDAVIPNLKWEEDVFPTAHRTALLKSDLVIAYFIGVYLSVMIIGEKVSFSVCVVSPDLECYEKRKSWTTTKKQAAHQAERFFDLYKGWISDLNATLESHGEKITVTEE